MIPFLGSCAPGFGLCCRGPTRFVVHSCKHNDSRAGDQGPILGWEKKSVCQHVREQESRETRSFKSRRDLHFPFFSLPGAIRLEATTINAVAPSPGAPSSQAADIIAFVFHERSFMKI
ncbi:LOW QUALITY PROTEIN: hypothetical protein BC936DRAFT_149455, partial [Jimgerdemannia flammicorona]